MCIEIVLSSVRMEAETGKLLLASVALQNLLCIVVTGCSIAAYTGSAKSRKSFRALLILTAAVTLGMNLFLILTGVSKDPTPARQSACFYTYLIGSCVIFLGLLSFIIYRYKKEKVVDSSWWFSSGVEEEGETRISNGVWALLIFGILTQLASIVAFSLGIVYLLPLSSKNPSPATPVQRLQGVLQI